jgi:hypothetical protein
VRLKATVSTQLAEAVYLAENWRMVDNIYKTEWCPSSTMANNHVSGHAPAS